VGGVALVVEPVELQRLHQVVDVGTGGCGARVIGAVQDIGDDESGKDADDDEHHHQLDQREASMGDAWRGFGRGGR
jgi:hypothetical protein